MPALTSWAAGRTTMPARNETRTEAVIDATEEAVRASIEAAEKVARASLG